MFETILETAREYDWVVISVGTAGDDLQQQCPEFARQLAARQQKVIIHNFDPDFSRDISLEEDYLTTNRSKLPFPFKKKEEKPETEEICNVIATLLKLNKKVILLSAVTPQLPDAFLIAANNNKQQLASSQLSVIGSYSKDSLTVIYKPSFLENGYGRISYTKSLFKTTPKEFIAFWSRIKTKNHTYDSLGNDEEHRNSKFIDIQTRFQSMGSIHKTLGAIQASDLEKDETLTATKESIHPMLLFVIQHPILISSLVGLLAAAIVATVLTFGTALVAAAVIGTAAGAASFTGGVTFLGIKARAQKANITEPANPHYFAKK